MPDVPAFGQGLALCALVSEWIRTAHPGQMLLTAPFGGPRIDTTFNGATLRRGISGRESEGGMGGMERLPAASVLADMAFNSRLDEVLNRRRLSCCRDKRHSVDQLVAITVDGADVTMATTVAIANAGRGDD